MVQILCCDSPPASRKPCIREWRLAFAHAGYAMSGACAVDTFALGRQRARLPDGHDTLMMCQAFHFPVQGRCRWLASSVAAPHRDARSNPMAGIAYTRGGVYPKDVLCNTLHSAPWGQDGLHVHDALLQGESFTPPCWTLPGHEASLRRQLFAAQASTRRWIVKQAAGTQGEGHKMFGSDAELARALDGGPTPRVGRLESSL